MSKCFLYSPLVGFRFAFRPSRRILNRRRLSKQAPEAYEYLELTLSHTAWKENRR